MVDLVRIAPGDGDVRQRPGRRTRSSCRWPSSTTSWPSRATSRPGRWSSPKSKTVDAFVAGCGNMVDWDAAPATETRLGGLPGKTFTVTAGAWGRSGRLHGGGDAPRLMTVDRRPLVTPATNRRHVARSWSSSSMGRRSSSIVEHWAQTGADQSRDRAADAGLDLASSEVTQGRAPPGPGVARVHAWRRSSR